VELKNDFTKPFFAKITIDFLENGLTLDQIKKKYSGALDTLKKERGWSEMDNDTAFEMYYDQTSNFFKNASQEYIKAGIEHTKQKFGL
jgi:hypothetical protein